jgi:hypothetical protein
MNIQMAVEMDHGYGAVRLVDTPQQRECNSVISAEGDHAGKGLPGLRNAFLVRVCVWLAHEEAVVAFLDLLDRPRVVIPVFRSSPHCPPEYGCGKTRV